MSESKTAGPWRWVPAANDYPTTYLVSGASDFDDMVDDKRIVLAIYESHGGGDMPNEANAALIAASPELLAACKAMLELLDLGIPSHTINYNQTCAEARAAIEAVEKAEKAEA